MTILTNVFQWLTLLLLFIAAIIATFRPKRFEGFTPLFSSSKVWRIIQATFLWVAFFAMLISIPVPFFAFFAACLTLASSIPPAFRGLYSKPSSPVALPFALAIGAIVVGITQPLGLRVMALPKATDLAFKPVPFKVVKTYDEGLWFEGIAVAGDGTLYLSGNRDLDFSKTDYYAKAQGEIIERKPNGNERVIFKTPQGITSGVPVVAPDGSLYLTGHGNPSVIWHIDTTGKAAVIATLEKNAWPNGIDFGPDNMLYAADSNLGLIWRIDPATGKVSVAIRDNALKARTFISIAPGANGLHFKGKDLLVTVSDRATLLQYSLNNDGNFGSLRVLANGIPGDDFAIGNDGSVFITTHPYNTVVQIAPSGNQTIIGNKDQHIVGATDAAFGKTENDKNKLYVVTDGGAFTGGPKTRGELIVLEPYAKR